MRLPLSGGTRSSVGQVNASPLRLIRNTNQCLLTLTSDDPNDAFWLAQTYFLTHQYSRAERLLTRPFPTSVPRDPPIVPSLTNGHFNTTLPPSLAELKGKGKDTTSMGPPAALPPHINSRLPVGPSEMIDVAVEYDDGVSRLVDMSVACRYLAAQCQVRQGKWAEATEMLGEANPFRGSGRSGPSIPNVDGGIKVSISSVVIPWFY